jgi:6-phosphogluconolactonase
MSYRMHAYADAETLTRELGNTIIASLRTALAKREVAKLVVSGGRTPAKLFNYLSMQTLAWERVVITLADERCVAPDSEDSNARLVHKELIRDKAETARFIPLYHDELSIDESLNKVNNDLQALGKPYDVVVLGMGEDGHTASIFPRGSNLSDLLDEQNPSDCLHTDPVTASPLRISQTRQSLLNTEQLILHLSGEKKQDVFLAAVESESATYPIQYFVHQDRLPLDVYYNP